MQAVQTEDLVPQAAQSLEDVRAERQKREREQKRLKLKQVDATTIRSLLTYIDDLLTEPGITEIAFNDPASLKIHYEKNGKWMSRPFLVPPVDETVKKAEIKDSARDLLKKKRVTALVTNVLSQTGRLQELQKSRQEREQAELLRLKSDPARNGKGPDGEMSADELKAQIQRNYDFAYQLAIAVARYNDNDISDTNPILSAVLPEGERCQFVIPPATVRGKISMTIRRPSMEVRTMESYLSGGFFDEIHPVTTERLGDAELAELYADLTRTDIDVEEQRRIRSRFLLRAVELGRVVVVAGSTGSGKTTFMKTLMQAIPKDERIITIEDCPELMYGLTSHENRVHLMYASEGGENAITSASSMMKSCLRMKPDRILLAELRGGETYDWLQSVLSGHAGSITSCHASNCSAVFPYLAMKVMQSPVGKNLPYEEIMTQLRSVIDIVVHIANNRGQRHITEVYFAGSDKKS